MTTSTTVTACPDKPRKPKSKQRYSLKLRARSLRKKGVGTRAIAKGLGISTKELRELEAREIKPKPDQFDGPAWRAFLESLTRVHAEDPREVHGYVLDDTCARAYYRWTVEEVRPSIFSADRFLTTVGLHVEHFFEWCERADPPREPWACGEPPEWMREPAAS